MPASVCGQDVDTLVTAASFEEANRKNISSNKLLDEQQEGGDHQLADNDEVLLEDDLIKAALCALQTPATADSSPSGSEEDLSYSATFINGQNDDVIEIDDLPLMSIDSGVPNEEDSDDNIISTNQNADIDISANHNTANIELQFDDEEQKDRNKEAFRFHKDNSVNKIKEFATCFTSVPSVKPLPVPQIQPVATQPVTQKLQTHARHVQPPPQTTTHQQISHPSHAHRSTQPRPPIMYIQYIPLAAQPPHFIPPPSFVTNPRSMRPKIVPASATPVTFSAVNMAPLKASVVPLTPSATALTPLTPPITSKPTTNNTSEIDEDDIPLAKISNVTSLKIGVTASGTAHLTEVERRHKCDICGAGFQWKSHLRRHEKTHTNEKYECDICHAGFGQQSYFNAHYKSHFNDKPYKCEACGKRFVQSTHLKIHLMIHTGEKPYQCQFCKARFTQHGNLKRHVRVHTGERPFHCTECPSSFTHSSDLTRHTRIHTGEKPYKCAHCDSAFATNGNLKSHLKTHTPVANPFKCTLCDAAFNLESYLKLHMRTHINEQPFVCACGKAFEEGLKFNSHLQARVSPFCALVS